jgi:hypothetical protein
MREALDTAIRKGVTTLVLMLACALLLLSVLLVACLVQKVKLDIPKADLTVVKDNARIWAGETGHVLGCLRNPNNAREFKCDVERKGSRYTVTCTEDGCLAD